MVEYFPYDTKFPAFLRNYSISNDLALIRKLHKIRLWIANDHQQIRIGSGKLPDSHLNPSLSAEKQFYEIN